MESSPYVEGALVKNVLYIWLGLGIRSLWKGCKLGLNTPPAPSHSCWDGRHLLPPKYGDGTLAF